MLAGASTKQIIDTDRARLMDQIQEQVNRETQAIGITVVDVRLSRAFRFGGGAESSRARNLGRVVDQRPPAIRLFDAGMGDGTVLARLMRPRAA